MSVKVHLVCIDFQNDFSDPNGSLYVKGGEEDAKRTADFIARMIDKINDIIVTMDSHRLIDISHPTWWQDTHGKKPNPFTQITVDDMESGRWRTRQPGARTRTLQYLKKLEAGQRYPHVIWPEHCIIGDQGHNLHPVLSGAIHEWERKRYLMPDVVTKGSNPWTEHFSAVKAEVPDPEDPSTQVNRRLIDSLERADLVVWTGEALSHCLAHTFRDTAANFSNPEYVKKMVLLTDATSNVTGFETYGENFIREMKALGMQTSTTKDFLA